MHHACAVDPSSPALEPTAAADRPELVGLEHIVLALTSIENVIHLDELDEADVRRLATSVIDAANGTERVNRRGRHHRGDRSNPPM